ncbi:hypothetical protein TYRP_023393 [Tyrophagus putrescentiae]|nr:hypothetical protein TYRP_023393 [Tyrophagus putrescentiae]
MVSGASVESASSLPEVTLTAAACCVEGNPKSHNSSSFEPSPSQATSRTGTTASGIPSGLPRKNIFGWRGKNPPL